MQIPLFYMGIVGIQMSSCGKKIGPSGGTSNNVSDYLSSACVDLCVFPELPGQQ